MLDRNWLCCHQKGQKEIEEALKKKKAKLEDIKEIKVKTSPAFTGLRVGVTVANALGWVLGIKVNGKKMVTPNL